MGTALSVNFLYIFKEIFYWLDLKDSYLLYLKVTECSGEHVMVTMVTDTESCRNKRNFFFLNLKTLHTRM